MLFFSKRSNVPNSSSNVEACMSILGLFLAVGLIGGLSALVYGLVRGISSGIVGGAVVLGLSAFFSIILALVFVYCLKKNDVNSNTIEQRSSTNQHQSKQHRPRQSKRPIQHVQTHSPEIRAFPNTHRSEHQQQKRPNVYNTAMISPPANSGLSDSTHFGYGKQIPLSPSKTSSFVFLNQSSGSVNNNNYNSHVQQIDYNRY